MNVTPKALGVLFHLASSGDKATVDALRESFPGYGRDYFLTAMTELVSHGFLSRKTYKVGSRMVTETVVTDEGLSYLTECITNPRRGRIIRPLLQHIQQNIPIPTSMYNYSEYTRLAAREEEEVGYDFFEKSSSDEFAEERERQLKAKKEAAVRAKEERNAKKLVKHRSMIEPRLWTSSDTGYEFSDRLLKIWNVKPWSIVQSRFIPALADMRARLDTDGEIELKMIDLFFESVDFQKYDDPQMLWRMFIKRSPELAVQAKRLIVSPEELAAAQVAADKSWDWMDV